MFLTLRSSVISTILGITWYICEAKMEWILTFTLKEEKTYSRLAAVRLDCKNIIFKGEEENEKSD